MGSATRVNSTRSNASGWAVPRSASLRKLQCINQVKHRQHGGLARWQHILMPPSTKRGHHAGNTPAITCYAAATARWPRRRPHRRLCRLASPLWVRPHHNRRDAALPRRLDGLDACQRVWRVRTALGVRGVQGGAPREAARLLQPRSQSAILDGSLGVHPISPTAGEASAACDSLMRQ